MPLVLPNASVTPAHLVGAIYVSRNAADTTIYTDPAETPTTVGASGLSLVVPAKHVGIHAHRWPAAFGTDPAPTYGFGTWRSHDANLSWNKIETATATYDWTRFDAWLAEGHARGCRLIYTLYGTPSFYTNSTVEDDYGAVGGNGPPDVGAVFTNVYNFVAQVLIRVNAFEAANSTVLDFVLEVWNEPGFPSPFWVGTAVQLVQVARGCRAAIDDNRPGTPLISPGFTGDPNRIGTFMTTLASGVTGRDLVDGVAYHPYSSNPAWYNYQAVGPDLPGRTEHVAKLLQNINDQTPDPDLPVWMTEVGYISSAFWAGLGAAGRRHYIGNVQMQWVLHGAQAVCWYSHGGGHAGDPINRADVATTFNDLHLLGGKTLTAWRLYRDGRVTYSFSDATEAVF